MATPAEIQAFNQSFIESFSNPGMYKYSQEALFDFTRTIAREEGIHRNYMPLLPVSPSDLTILPDTDKPCLVIDKEPSSPAAVSIPFAGVPIRWFLRGDRYVVQFDRKHTPMFQKDVAELMTYRFDIRQVLFDNALKDLLYEEDRAFLTAIYAALIGPNNVVPWSGVPQWRTINGGLTRDTWQAGLSIMPSTPSHLEPSVLLLNNITIREFAKWGRDEIGGDFTEQLLLNGWGKDITLDGKKVLVTIKRSLVPDNRVIYLADPRAVGKFCALEDITLHVKRELWMIEFMGWEVVGGAIGHTGGLAIADFV